MSILKLDDGKTIVDNFQIWYFPEGVEEGSEHELVYDEKVERPKTFQVRQEAEDYLMSEIDPQEWGEQDLDSFRIVHVHNEIEPPIQ